MKEFEILTDSSIDLSEEYVIKNNVRYVKLQFTCGDEHYYNYLDNRELPLNVFYERLKKGDVFKTNQVNIDTYTQMYQELYDAGKDILTIAFSSGLSGTYNSAAAAAAMFKEEHPDAVIYVLDSLAASSGEGLLVELAVQQRNQGKSIEEVKDYVEKLIPHICHWFTVDNLDTLKRGGRVSAPAAFIANALKIKPVLHVDDEGHLIPMSKVIGRKASIRAMLAQMEDTYLPEYKTVFISNAGCIDDATYLKGKIIERWPDVSVSIFNVGAVITSHSGPGTLALFFVGTKR